MLREVFTHRITVYLCGPESDTFCSKICSIRIYASEFYDEMYTHRRLVRRFLYTLAYLHKYRYHINNWL